MAERQLFMPNFRENNDKDEDIDTNPNRPDSGSVIALSLIFKMYLSIYLLWIIVN